MDYQLITQNDKTTVLPQKLEDIKLIKTDEHDTIHFLKLAPRFYISALMMEKAFEIRQNDRNFKIGHFIRLDEFESGKDFSEQVGFTGRIPLFRKITYITEFGQKDGCVVLGLEKASLDDSSFWTLVQVYPELLRSIGKGIRW